MARYLTLCPLADPEDLQKDLVLVSTQLMFDSDDRIFGQIVPLRTEPTIKPRPIPEQLLVRVGQDETREDVYGAVLTFVSAGELKTMEYPEDTSVFNLAIRAFIAVLPDDTPIILWWG